MMANTVEDPNHDPNLYSEIDIGSCTQPKFGIISLLRVGVLKSGMHTAVLKEINSTCECFSKEVILEEFEAYFEVLEREVFHEMLR